MLETAACKLFCSEASWRVVDDAVQLYGGEGYMRSTGLERALRDARINRIVEGATEVMTSFVALMGMKGVGESFEEVLRDAYDAEPFVRVLPHGSLADIKNVTLTNVCEIGFDYDQRTDRIIVSSAIDNLTKGAAGQAVQCMNVAHGYPETTGLI